MAARLVYSPFVLVSLIVTLALCSLKIDAQSLSSADWTLNNVSDEAFTLSEYRGKPVILVFWATWCPYCKKLLPGMQRLHDKYANKGLTILAVNILEDWKPKVYWHNHEYSFDALLDGDKVAELYGVKGTPGVIFIAPNGQVLNVAYFSDPNHPSLEKFAQHYLTEIN